VPSFPSINLSRIPTPIPSISIPFGSSSGGGSSLGFGMGGGVHSTSTIPMSIPRLSGFGLPFGWNILSGFVVVLS
jgi:hypothetical protein